MSDASAMGLGTFIPEFDFLSQLGKASSPAGALPSMAQWVAPTVSVEDISKRIEELKAVQFWLEQNSRALAATVQALEVQRMTLSTLQGMNVNLRDMASAFSMPSAAPDHAHAQWPRPGSSAAPQPTAPPKTSEAAAEPPASQEGPASSAQAPGMQAALQWWGALTQQFQHIAQQALQDTAQQQAVLQATQMGAGLAQSALQAASELVRPGPASPPASAKPKPAPKTAAAPRKKAASTHKAVVADKPSTPKAAKKKPVAAKKSGTSPSRLR